MEAITFNTIDWTDYDIEMEDDTYSDSEEEAEHYYNIETYGRTKDDKSVFLRINNFQPYFYVEIPLEWKKTQLETFIEMVRKNVWPNKYKKCLINYSLKKRYKLYGFRAGKKYKFIRLEFNSINGMRRYQYAFNKKIPVPGFRKAKKYEVFETNIPPLLRFLHNNDINASGWVTISKYTKLPSKMYNTDYAIETDFINVKKLEDTSIAKLKILSFDIECTSGDGNFPQASRDEDKIIQIGSTFSRNGEEKCYYKHIITLGSCDPIEGADVESYESEKKVLMAWQKLILREDPDIITGYNIFGFDEIYIRDRSVKFGLDSLSLPKKKRFGIFGRIKNKMEEFKEMSLSSSALGDNKLKYYNITGRVQVDLFKVVQRDFKLKSYKLDLVAEHFLSGIVKFINGNQLVITGVKDIEVGNYIKLELDGCTFNDGEKFKVLNMKDDTITLNKEVKIKKYKKLKWGLAKDDVKPSDIFRLQKGSSADRKIVAEYCIQDCALVNKLMARLCVVTNNIGMSNVCSVPLSYLFFRGQGIKIFSLVAKYCRMYRYIIPVKKKPPPTCGGNKHSKNKKIKGWNEKWLKCTKCNKDFCCKECKKECNHLCEKVNEGYEGATVFPPDIGFYKRPIAVLDYASLYPSSMIMKNLSHETYVDNPKYDNLPGYKYWDAEYRNNDGSMTKCRYAQKEDGSLGIMPTILDKLLKQRKETKRLMKLEKDNFKKSVFDGLQLAYKVTANSLYGQMGSSVSPIYMKAIRIYNFNWKRNVRICKEYMENIFPPIVMNIYKYTKNNNDIELKKLFDKELIPKLNNSEFIQKLKDSIQLIINKCSIEPKTVYGDTDSVFIDFEFKLSDGSYYENKEALEFAIELGKIAGNLIKSRLLQPQDLEYEKTFYPFCILSKKRYVGNKYEFDPNSYYQNSMGIVLKRRDNANIVKKIVGGMVDILLNEIDTEKAVEFVRKSVKKLMKGKYPLADFETTKTLKAEYKDRTKLPHVCLADRIALRDPGNAPQVNTRIPFITITVNSKQIIAQKYTLFKNKVNKIYRYFVNNNINLINVYDDIEDDNEYSYSDLQKKYKNIKYLKKYIKSSSKGSYVKEYIKKIILNDLNNILEQKINELDRAKRFQDGIILIKDELKEEFRNCGNFKNYINSQLKNDIVNKLLQYFKPAVLQGDRVENPDFIRKIMFVLIIYFI